MDRQTLRQTSARMVKCVADESSRYCLPRRKKPSTTVLKRLATSTNRARSEEHTSELQSRLHLVCRLLLEKKTTRRAPATRPRTAAARAARPGARCSAASYALARGRCTR